MFLSPAITGSADGKQRGNAAKHRGLSCKSQDLKTYVNDVCRVAAVSEVAIQTSAVIFEKNIYCILYLCCNSTKIVAKTAHIATPQIFCVAFKTEKRSRISIGNDIKTATTQRLLPFKTKSPVTEKYVHSDVH